MKKISLFRVKRCQSKRVRFVTSSNDVKPPDQHRYKTRSLPSHNRLFWNPISSINESIAQMIKDTTSAGVKTGLAVLLFFCAGISPAVVAVDRYQSSVFEDEIIDCYARMAAASYNDIPDLKNRITCDSRNFSSDNNHLYNMTWHYTDFVEIFHELDNDQVQIHGQPIVDLYARCDDECDSEDATVQELVFAFRGTQNDLDLDLDTNSVKNALVPISHESGGIVVGPSDNQYTLKNPITLFEEGNVTLKNHVENGIEIVAFNRKPYGPFDPQQVPALDEEGSLWSGYQSALDPNEFKLPSGFKERADSNWTFLKQKLDVAMDWVQKKSHRRLYVRTTGHSLGGAQASIMALYALMYMEEVRQREHLSDDVYSVEAFSFTPPRTMPMQMAKLTQALLRHPHLAQKFKMHIFSNDTDPIGRAPHTLFNNWRDNVYHPVPENFVAGPHENGDFFGDDKKHYIAHVKHASAYDAYLTIGLDPNGPEVETVYHSLGATTKSARNQNNDLLTTEWRKLFPMPPKLIDVLWPVWFNGWSVSNKDKTIESAFVDRAHGITQFFKGHWSDQGTPTQRYYTTRMMDAAHDCEEYQTEGVCGDYFGKSIVTYEAERLGDQNLPRIADWQRVEGNVSFQKRGTYLIRSASNTSLCLTADFDSTGKVTFQPCASGAALLHQLVEVDGSGMLRFPYSTVFNGDDQKCLKNLSNGLKAASCLNSALGNNKKWKAKLDKRGFAKIISLDNTSRCLSGGGGVHLKGQSLSVAGCIDNQSGSAAIASQAFLIEPAVQHYASRDVTNNVVALASKAKNDLSCLKADLQKVGNDVTHPAETSECEFLLGAKWLTKTFEKQHAVRFLPSYGGYYMVQGQHRKKNEDGSEEMKFYCFVPEYVGNGRRVMVQPEGCPFISGDKKLVMPIMTPSGSLMLFVNPNRQGQKYNAKQFCWDSPEMTDKIRNAGTNPNRGVIKLRDCSYNRNQFADGKPSNVEWYAGRSFTDYSFREEFGATAGHKTWVHLEVADLINYGTNGTRGGDHCAAPTPAGSTTVPLGQSANGEPSFETNIYQELGFETMHYIHPVKPVGNASYNIIDKYGPLTVTPKTEIIVTPSGASSNCNHNRVLHQTIEYGVRDEFGNQAEGTIEHYMTDNLAYGKPASQSSKFGTTGLSNARKAVDGIKSPDYGQLSVASTAENDVDPWWEVNLQTLSKVRNVRLYNYALTGTGDSALPKEVLTSFTVEALSPSRRVIERISYGGVVNDYIDLPMTADGVMFVRVTLPHEGMLQLNEVEVAGWIDDTRGVNENVSLNKPVTQSSNWGNHPASRAVDGYLNNYTHTTLESEAWWKVSLEGVHAVKEVNVFNRTDCCKDRLKDFKIILHHANGDLTPFNPYKGYDEERVDDVYSFKFGEDAFTDIVAVTVQLEGTNYLSLADVQVLGEKLGPLPPVSKQTNPSSSGGGDMVYLDRHQLSCGARGISQFQLKRQGADEIYYGYECSQTASNELSGTYQSTTFSSDGGGDTRYLDRHALNCNNRPIHDIELLRNNEHDEVRYRYLCGSQKLFNVKTYNTPWDEFSEKSWYLDRHNVECPSNQVLSFVKLRTHWGNNRMRYKFKCGSPFK